MDPKSILKIFERNLFVLHRQIDGMSHEDSLLQLPFRGNCLNWVLGHIAVSRQTVLWRLDREQFMTEEQRNRYSRDSEPVLGEAPDIIQLEDLLEIMEKSQKGIEESLTSLSEEDLNREIGRTNLTPLGDALEFLAWHEAYHIGQTEYLRQLAGKDDKVI